MDNPTQEVNSMDPNIDQSSIKIKAPKTIQEEPRVDNPEAKKVKI